MTNPVDSAVDSAETKTSTKRGARDRYYFCAAIRGKNIIHEAIKANSPEEAQLQFEETHSLKAIVCDDGAKIDKGGNGWYLSMGTGQSDAQRMSVTVTPAQLARRTTAAFKAQFKGWNVYGSGLQACTVKIGTEEVEFEENQLVSIEFGDRVDPTNKELQKPKLKKKEVIRFEDLENAQQL